MKLSHDEQLRAIFLRNLMVGTYVGTLYGNGYITKLTADHVVVKLDRSDIVAVHYKEVTWPDE